MSLWCAIPIILMSLQSLPATAQAAGPREDVDYLKDVKPLLARHCISCHGAEKPRADLRLDTGASAIRGGKSGPAVVPGSPEESELLLAVLGEGVGERMPLKRPPLSAGEVEILRAWIVAGAPVPEDEAPSKVEAAHWAFTQPARSAPPKADRRDWPTHPIDALVLAQLEQENLAPSREADRVTLIRRATLDLIGLPPSADEVDAFLADRRPDAYERLVDRLLASPHYGERWGRWWLDMARYADSHGYSIDAPREIWAYRDWVIAALNRDEPFDEFTIDQLAGDLREGATLDQKIATGFHRNTPINMEGGIDKEQFRVDSVIDRVNTTGSVWLGLTIGCAQCHDHKYDPISQDDYYRLFAFLNNCDEPVLELATPEELAAKREARRRIDEYIAGIELDSELLKLQETWEHGLTPAQRQAQTEDVRKSLDVPRFKRDTAANRPAFEAFVTQAKLEVLEPHRKALAEMHALDPKIVTTLVVSELSERRQTRRLEGGDFTRPAEVVRPDVPRVLPRLDENPEREPNRLDLARWLVSPENPLTARVLVNRLWQAHFGRGLVETDSDFGTQGTLPSHPDLLDWLAIEAVERGWSLKAMHRMIVTSAAYRQSSSAGAKLRAIDPDNRRLARQSRVRLEAELVRDSALAAAGLLVARLGGPSVFPPQPQGVMGLGQIKREWNAAEGPDRYRRGLYTYIWRATPHPLLTTFDAPDATVACTRRARSNTPLQALLLLNDEAFHECAQALAGRALEECQGDDMARIDRIFRLALARTPTEPERARLCVLLQSERRNFGEDDERQEGAEPSQSSTNTSELAAWTSVARAVLNLDEFITRE
jgi:hypothetical protein